jgi:hypothetical protein
MQFTTLYYCYDRIALNHSIELKFVVQRWLLSVLSKPNKFKLIKNLLGDFGFSSFLLGLSKILSREQHNLQISSLKHSVPHFLHQFH